MPSQTRSTLEIIRAGLLFLELPHRKRAIYLLLAIIMSGGLDALAIATIYPTAMMIIDMKSVLNNTNMELFMAITGLQESSNIILMSVLIVCVLIVTSAIANIIILYKLRSFTATVIAFFMSKMVTLNINAPYVWFHNQNSAILLRRIYVDVGKWQNGLLQGILTVFQSIVMIVVALALVISISPTHGIASLSIIALVSVVIIVVSRPRIQKAGIIQRNASDAYVKSLTQLFAGIKEIQVSNLCDFFSNITDSQQQQVQVARLHQAMWQNVPPIILQTIGQIGFLAILYLFWLQNMSEPEIFGQMAFLGMISSRLIPAVNRLSGALGGLWDSLPFVDGLIDIHDGVQHYNKEFSSQNALIPCPLDWKTISYNCVGFRYPEANKTALNDISVRFERGKSYGIVGLSGAGKSTFIDILLGLYPPTTGQVLIDDISITDINIETWQRFIGYVPQKPYLADNSIRANVAFGLPQDTVEDSAVWHTLNLAGLSDVVHSLKNGLEATIGENGMKLSGGQIQRIAVARALFKRPEVLVLDEATSALDSETEAKVQAAIEGMHGSITTIAIAHRVSTLKNCDEIIIFDQGFVSQVGTYDDLMASSNVFRRLAAQLTDKQPIPESEAV